MNLVMCLIILVVLVAICIIYPVYVLNGLVIILFKATNFIGNISENLIGGFNYVNNLVIEIGNILGNIFSIANKNIEQFQSDNQVGFIVLASVCLIVGMYGLLFLITYKIIEDEKYEKNQLMEKGSSDIEWFYTLAYKITEDEKYNKN